MLVLSHNINQSKVMRGRDSILAFLADKPAEGRGSVAWVVSEYLEVTKGGASVTIAWEPG